MSKGRESAYPQEELRHADDGAIHRIGGGLTKREWMAGMALQGMKLCDDTQYSENDHKRGLPKRKAEWVAASAVRYADALLAELEKGES